MAHRSLDDQHERDEAAWIIGLEGCFQQFENHFVECFNMLSQQIAAWHVKQGSHQHLKEDEEEDVNSFAKRCAKGLFYENEETSSYDHFDFEQAPIFDEYQDDVYEDDVGEKYAFGSDNSWVVPHVADGELLFYNNIFQSMCAGGGKGSWLVIDFGCCENMIAKEMVEKWQLNFERYPRPFKISWFKKGGEVPVRERCLVKFSVGKYHYELWCDVRPLDACHILLGKYFQHLKGVKYVLTPLKKAALTKVFEENGLASNHQNREFIMLDGYLFKGIQFCIPEGFLRLQIIHELHGRGIGGHFGGDKTLALVQEHDVERYVNRCMTCQQAKGGKQFFRKIVGLHGLPKTLTSYRDSWFWSHLWRTLWKLPVMKLQFSNTYQSFTAACTDIWKNKPEDARITELQKINEVLWKEICVSNSRTSFSSKEGRMMQMHVLTNGDDNCMTSHFIDA